MSDAEYLRMRAVAKQLRRNGGDNQTLREYVAKLQRAAVKAERKAKNAQMLLDMAASPVARLKQPIDCPEGFEPVCVFDCGEASFFFEDENQEVIEMDWPFVESFVYPDDCEHYGIRVEQS